MLKVFAMIRAEFARLWATPMSRLAFLALMIVPLLYGGLYLWANQNPYDRLDRIPVALVVADTGVTQNGKTTHFGDDVADNLIKDGTFAWQRVSEAEAKRGVENGDFDFSLTLPKDFSEALASSQTDAPRQAEVILTTNDANSYLATTIGTQAAKTVQTQIVATVNKQAAQTFLDGLAKIRGNLVEAADGGTKLTDGAQTAREGADALAQGAGQARDGAGELGTGLNSLRDGSQTLAGGLDTLRNQTAQLPDQTRKLADGAAQVAAGNGKIAQVGDEVAKASTDLINQIPDARAKIAADLASAGVPADAAQRILSEFDRVGGLATDSNSKVQGVVGQLDQLSTGSSALAAGSKTLADATPQLAGGIGQLADGAGTLRDGAVRAADAAGTLRSGLDTLTDKLGELGGGLTTLHGGLGTLTSGLSDGAQQIPDASITLRTEQAKNISNPVNLHSTAVTSAGTYGAGLAPFFVSLAGWIGIYALFLILKPFSRRAITALHSPIKITIAGWMTPAILGAIQMIALFGIVAGTLGFQVSNPVGAYGMMALASVTFAAIILALNVWLGSVGQFLGLVLMVIQLVTAGGTFPWQTLPAPLAWLHHFLPMSFAVDGMRQLMYGGNLEAAGHDAIVLALIALGALVISALGVTRMTHYRTLRDLQPSLIG
ncbi:YhgE/Pip domain-containing protein [Mycetocola tolaasinivorans]|uniref:YhgE/Pip domain-containing protein n=1 Tax=Mycetocola tolaasinivorans TaxID=76635 RepID=A0A3L7A1V0_9MICO|nr:YhgE/Pip domain-containing protein [Mycetocola tolaasinivorans]RLP73352.1 YhgE/Pip domain-containing protein [Mycetocola tolaasinivorans]